jgi:hypothetical protein
MKYVKVTSEDYADIYLEQAFNGTWSVMNEAPSYPGNIPTTVQVTFVNGVVSVIGDADASLIVFIETLFLGESRKNIIEYLPAMMQELAEFKEFTKSENYEFDLLHDGVQVIIDDSYILTAREARIIEWERDLKIVPYGTLAQRKSFIISYLRGQGKLNESKIKSVVEGFTGGDSIITFADSTIRIQILVPPGGDIYRLPDVERALNAKIPAHINLTVERYYSSWNDVKTNYTDWSAVAALADWQALVDYIP